MADFSQWWWQAAGVDPGPGPGPDPGDPIGQSLRFRGSSSLSGHTGGSGTASVWIKRGKLGAAQTVMPGIAFDASDKLNSSVALFRDSSAWMHVVVNANGTYVNGVSVASGNAISAGTIGASCELYLAAFYFIDGQALDPTTFGRFNSQGVWVPVDAQGLTYGSNGFKLTFEDPSNIGKDYSGNGNDFTDTGFELANQSSSDYDLMKDSPTQNYAVISPLYLGASTSNANLTTANTTGKPTILGLAGNVGVDGASVAWDGTEAGWNSTGSINFGQQPGGFKEISTRTMPAPAIFDGREHFQALTGPGQGGYQMYINQTRDETLGIDSFTEVGIIPGNTAVAEQFILDCFADITTTSFTLNPGWGWSSNARISVSTDGSANSWTVTNPDQVMGNLVISITSPTEFRYIKIYEINGGGSNFGEINTDNNPILSIAQSTFPDGLWWVKDRVNSNQHQLVDSVNGTSAVITSPAGSVTAYAAPAGSSVAWCWNAADTNGGFSITNGTHGLGTTPAMVMDRALNVWHQSLPAGQGLVLKSSAPAAAQAWTVDGTTVSGPGGGSYYSWAEIPGYSAIGMYSGNGNPSGAFNYCGFKPAWVMAKAYSSDTGFGWFINDTTRQPNNPNGYALQANVTAAELNNSSAVVDLLSNGFKIRGGSDQYNKNNVKYIYAAFAENPFQSPATAR